MYVIERLWLAFSPHLCAWLSVLFLLMNVSLTSAVGSSVHSSSHFIFLWHLLMLSMGQKLVIHLIFNFDIVKEKLE